MPRQVYACRFEVPKAEGLDEVISAYRDWLLDHYRRRRGIPNFSFEPMAACDASDLPTDHSLTSIVYAANGDKAVRILWSHPDDNDNGLRWSNDIRVGQFENRCSIEHLISIESIEYSLAPARLLIGSPRVVRDICGKTPTYVGEMQVKAIPYDLQQGALDDFLALLTSDLRKLPIVLLSPYARGEPNLIDADQLARNLAGVAVVVRVQDPEVTWDFADDVGRHLSCFNGAGRIYWPGFSKKAEPRGHRLFFGAWVEQVGPTVASRTIERAVFAVAAFRFVPDQKIAALIRKVESEERQELLSQKKATGDDFWEDYECDLARLEKAQERIQELESENANLRANQQVLISGALATDEVGETPENEVLSFSSVLDSVKAAATRCRNIEVLDSAYSAAASSPFNRPFDIYKALTDLNEIVDAWRKNRDETGSGGDLLLHLRDRGWGKRSRMHISNTTRGKYRTHYEFEYRGRKQLFEPHITIGAGDPNSCASIHFIFDQGREKMIIGHAGKHLPNTKT
jgi:hypothetical protein